MLRLPALAPVLLAIVLSPPTLLRAQSPDACAEAVEIGIGSTRYTTTAATSDGPLSCALIGNDVWFLFTAPRLGSWRFELCANTDYDAALAIYPASTPCPPSSGDELACNDDACGGGGPPIIVVTLAAGQVVRLQVGGWDGATGTGEIIISEVPPLPPGADIRIGEISNFVQFGREGNEVGCAIASVTCNAGADPLDWFGNPDPRHPFITSAAYRLEDDRLVQIGMSFAKHGFAAAQADACGLGCAPFPNGTRLGPGCSDTYGAATNAAQGNLGPRHEIDPWTGEFDFRTSALGGGGFDGVERRLRITDDDLDPAQHPGAVWFCEVYVLAHDDQDHRNSIAWQPFVPSGVPGSVWSFNTRASTTVGPAIYAWPGATVVAIADAALDDGRVYLAAKAIESGNRTWRYEYAIQNLDLGAGIGSFSVPAAASISLSDIEFHSPRQFEPGFDDQPWSIERTTDAVVWSTDREDSATPQNPLRWGALYSFGFTADAPPGPADLTLGVHFVTTVPSLRAAAIGPEGDRPGVRFIRGDADGDGVFNALIDMIFLLRAGFVPGAAQLPCLAAADVDADQRLDTLGDALVGLSFGFVTGAPPIPAPHPECGTGRTGVQPLGCDPSDPGCNP